MKIDVIILSNGKTKELREMTQQTIDTLHASEKDHEFDVLVFEQQHDVGYRQAFVINYHEPFHYNRLMNHGVEMATNEWIVLANNDLIFHRGWLTECLKHDYLSMSPNFKAVREQGVEEGHEIGVAGQVMGWCLLANRKVFDKIGKIDESVNFWYSDHVYADQLREAGIEHALVKGALVQHLDGKTLKTCTEEERLKYCDNQKKIYAPKLLRPSWEID